MKFKYLIDPLMNINLSEDLLNYDVKNIAIDPKKVQKGDVFLLLKEGEDADKKIKEALSSGAKFALAKYHYGLHNCFTINDPRRCFAVFEKRLHNCACDKMKIIGVTGTNGKTTTTNLIYDILKGSGKKVGIIGTLGAKVDGDFEDTGFTTPDPDKLHEIFQKMQNKNVEYVVMEVSAHALALKKMEGIKFDIAVLTNITQDHLDFFESMDNYEKTKFKLFHKSFADKGVVCSDGVDIFKFSKFCNIPFITYGINSPSDVFAIDIKKDLVGTQFICNCNDEILRVDTPLAGEFNVQNSLAAITVANMLGVDFNIIKRELKYAPEVEGRFNVIAKDNKKIVIDFAHTPDGLEKIIKNVRDLTPGKVITVFGCGGNRDKSKRPIMGKIASSLSDQVYLTSDNPRFEDPLAIINDIKNGIIDKNYVIEPNRPDAIRLALKNASENDTVIIAGKGAEKYQEIAGIKHPYDDYSIVYDFFRSNMQIIKGDKNIEHKR